MKNKTTLCPNCGSSHLMLEIIKKVAVVVEDGRVRVVRAPLYPLWRGLVCQNCKRMLPADAWPEDWPSEDCAQPN